MALSQTQVLDFSRPKVAGGISEVALHNTFNLGQCKADFHKVLSLYMIIDMFDCTGGTDLTQVQKDCLLGKLQSEFTLNCS